MKKYHFPYIAVVLGIFFLILVLAGSKEGADGSTTLPLLTLLVVSEFAFIANAIAVYLGITHIRAGGSTPFYLVTTILCAVFTVVFMVLGVRLWPL